MKLEDIAVHNDLVIRGFCGEYRWLSNFWPCIIHGACHDYPSAEHAYQAAKAPANKRYLFTTGTPAQAKHLGSTFNLDRNAWDARKESVMLAAVRLKFKDPELASKLLATNQRYLEELNVWKDAEWGVYNGVGQNKLGHILMKVRDEIAASIIGDD
jgi:ribA/ribD-fused uncharacterized protein